MRKDLLLLLINLLLFSSLLIAQPISVSPDFACPGTSNFNVTISGNNTNFMPGTTTCAVIMGTGITITGDAINANVFNGTTDIPAGTAPGSYGVRIYEAGCNGNSWNCNNCFTVGAGSIESVSPPSAPPGSTISLAVTGNCTGFVPGTTSCAQLSRNNEIYELTGSASSSTTYSGSVNLPCDASSGNYDLTIFEGPGCSGNSWSCSNCFNITNPGSASVSITPNLADAGDLVNFTLNGTNTCFLPGSTTCGVISKGGERYMFNGAASSSTTFLGIVDFPCTATSGSYDVTIYESGCNGPSYGCSNCFTVNGVSGGTISSSSSTAERGRVLNLLITGTGTCFEPGVTDRVILDNGSDTYTLLGTAISATQFVTDDPTPFVLPCDAPLGLYDIEVPLEGASGGFTWVCTDCISVQDPSNPLSFNGTDSALRGATTSLDLDGICTEFLVGTTDCAEITDGTNTYIFSGSASSATSFSGTLTLPGDAPSGPYDAIIYQGPGCTGTSWNCSGCFTVEDSLSLTPGQGLRGSTVTVVASAAGVDFGNFNVTCMEISGNGMTYTVNGAQTGMTTFEGDFAIPSDAIPGNYDAVLYGGPACSGESWSCTSCFAINDSISVSPASEDPGNTINLSITGVGTDFQVGTTTCVEVSKDGVIYVVTGSASTAVTFSGNFMVPLNAAFGLYDVTIYQGPDCSGVSWTCSDCFEVSGAPLPVDWLYSRAEPVGKEIVVYWGTAVERNNELFVIERSRDGISWDRIGDVNAIGFSNRPVDYLFIDQQPLEGDNYYRIVQIDFDGNFDYSEVMVVPFADPVFGVSVAPNPVYDMTSLTISLDQDQKINIRLISISGQIQFFEERLFEKGVHTFQLEMQDLPSSIYLLTIESKDQIQVQKLVKM